MRFRGSVPCVSPQIGSQIAPPAGECRVWPDMRVALHPPSSPCIRTPGYNTVPPLFARRLRRLGCSRSTRCGELRQRRREVALVCPQRVRCQRRGDVEVVELCVRVCRVSVKVFKRVPRDSRRRRAQPGGGSAVSPAQPARRGPDRRSTDSREKICPTHNDGQVLLVRLVPLAALLALLALDGERPLRLGRSGDDPDRAFDALVLFSWCAAEADDPESLVVRCCVVGYPLDASAGGKARRGRVGPVLCRRE